MLVSNIQKSYRRNTFASVLWEVMDKNGLQPDLGRKAGNHRHIQVGNGVQLVAMVLFRNWLDTEECWLDTDAWAPEEAWLETDFEEGISELGESVNSQEMRV